METHRTEVYKGYSIGIHYDTDYQTYDEEHLVQMVTSHKRYTFGNDLDFDFDSHDNWVDAEQALLKEHDILWLSRVYLFDHSGLRLRTSPFSCAWDSAQLGFAVLTREQFESHMGQTPEAYMTSDYTKEWMAKEGITTVEEMCEKYVESHVKYLDDIEVGNVFGFTIHTHDGDDVDACWGYVGSDTDHIMDECRAIIDHRIAQQMKRRYQRLKELINNKVSLRIRNQELNKYTL